MLARIGYSGNGWQEECRQKLQFANVNINMTLTVNVNKENR